MITLVLFLTQSVLSDRTRQLLLNSSWNRSDDEIEKVPSLASLIVEVSRSTKSYFQCMYRLPRSYNVVGHFKITLQPYRSDCVNLDGIRGIIIRNKSYDHWHVLCECTHDEMSYCVLESKMEG